MAIDLEQFHQVFFEESLEGLDIMENSLMELDPAAIDSETINAIFRCAHSIKGGSATFGFTSIAEFTHVLETILDQVRDGTRSISNDDINIFLKSVDCMRDMLQLIQNGDMGSTPEADELIAVFNKMLGEDLGESGCQEADVDSQPVSGSSVSTWKILFSPNENIFLTGNEPSKILSELASLGELNVECDISRFPERSAFDYEVSYLSWDLTLLSECDLSDIESVFEWVVDDCELNITCHQAEASSVKNEKSLWKIEFVPELDLLRTGNEPSRIFRALSEHGDVNVSSDLSKMPDISSMDSENCYLSWSIELESDSATEDDLRAVFEWVEDDAKISISCTENVSASAQQEDSAITQSDDPKASIASAKSSASNTAQKAVAKKPVKKASAENSSIRVGIDKVDSLINMVGELVITQSMLGQLGDQFDSSSLPKLMEGLGQLEQNTRELQESVMKIRMLPISFVFSRFPRMVRDLSQTLGKSVNIVLNGEQTELDKTVMEKIGDPMVHLVRNAVDHGIESPEIRTEKGKDPTGTITLNAFHQSGNVVIEIIDDGKGLDRDGLLEKGMEKGLVSAKEASNMSDEQVFDLIFQPGFSTAKEVSDVSGRGVGMDVVKRNIQDLNGTVEIKSAKNAGSTITIKLPLTLAILDGQLVRVGQQTYVLPLVSIVESLQCRSDYISNVAGGSNVFKLRDDYVPIVELYRSFSVVPDSTELENSLLVVVESDGEKVGIVVDELLAQQQVVIKSLEQNYQRVQGVSGATILGDGTVALILDISGILKLSGDQLDLSAQRLGDVVHHQGNLLNNEAQPHSAAG